MSVPIGWMDLDGNGAHYFVDGHLSLCGDFALPDYVADGPDPSREAAILQFARRERMARQQCPVCAGLLASDSGDSSGTDRG